MALPAANSTVETVTSCITGSNGIHGLHEHLATTGRCNCRHGAFDSLHFRLQSRAKGEPRSNSSYRPALRYLKVSSHVSPSVLLVMNKARPGLKPERAA